MSLIRSTTACRSSTAPRHPGKWGSAGGGDGQFAFRPYTTDGFGIAVDGGGNVYVADTANNRIQKFDGNGQFLGKWGGGGGGDGQFNHPYDVAVDGGGNVYVADGANHRVQKFDGGGRFVGKWGSEGTGTASSHSHAALPDSGGNVYVADIGSGLSRVQKLTRTVSSSPASAVTGAATGR